VPTILLDNLPVCDPATAYQECKRLRLDTSWALKPNRFILPRGSAAGRGWVLIPAARLRSLGGDLDPNALHTLTFLDDRNMQVVLPHLVWVKAHNITPGADGDPAATYLLELADPRYLYGASPNRFYANPVNAQYNVRAPAGGTYYSQSLNAGSPWTWQTMLSSLWSAAVGTSTAISSQPPPLPFTPDGTPEDFRFVGVSAWEAYHFVLSRLGCAFVWGPDLSAPGQAKTAIVQVGAADAANTAAVARWKNWRLDDDGFEESTRSKTASQVTVFFHCFSQYDDAASASRRVMAPAYSVTVPAPATVDLSGVEPGSTKALWDDLPAVLDASGSVTNTAALNSRAAERAADYYRQVAVKRTARQYSGFVADDGLLPGAQVSAIVWKDTTLGGTEGAGVGAITEVVQYPPVVVPDGEGGWSTDCCGDDGVTGNLMPPDLGRHTYPPTPPASAVVAAAPLTGSTNDWDPGNGSTVDVSSPTTVNVTGLAAPSDAAAGGRTVPAEKTITNTGSFPITLTHLDGSSAPGNQFSFPTGTSQTLLPGASITVAYDPVLGKWVPRGNSPGGVLPAPKSVQTVSTNQTQFPVGYSPYVPVSAAAPAILYGIVPSTGVQPTCGQQTTITNTGTSSITIPNESASAADPTYRVRTSTGADLVLQPGGSVTLWYDCSIDRWRDEAVSASNSAGGAAGTAAEYTGTASNGIFSTVFDKTNATGLHGSVSVKNTGANRLTAMLTGWDFYGSSDFITYFVSPGTVQSVCFDITGIGSLYPPYKEAKLQVAGGGGSTTYDVWLVVV